MKSEFYKSKKQIKESSKKLISNTIKFVSRELHSSEKNLDVLAGYCNFLIPLVKKTKINSIGVDNSDYIIQIAKKNIKNAGLCNLIKIKKADARQLSFPSNYFDSVTNFAGWGDVALFCGKNGIKKVLKEMHRVLKPNGILVIAFPLIETKKKIQQTDEKLQIYLYGKKRHYSKDFFEKELSKNKIKIIEEEIISTPKRINPEMTRELLKRHKKEVEKEFRIKSKSYEQVMKKFGKFIEKNGYSQATGLVIIIGKKLKEKSK